MYKVVSKRYLVSNIVSMDIEAPLVAEKAMPGEFLIVKKDEFAERIPLTICDYDRDKGTVNIIFQVVGKSTEDMEKLEIGEYFQDIVGPLGQKCEFLNEDFEKLKNEKYIFIAGGVGTAPIYPQVKWFLKHGLEADVIIGARTKDLLILEEDFKELGANVYVCTDNGSYGLHGNVTDMLKKLVVNDGRKYTKAVAIGPMIMMKFATLMTKKLDIPTIVSLNPLMIDGTGMCGACRVEIDGKVKFACVDGPEFDGFKVNFDEAQNRLKLRDENRLEEHENEDCPIEHEEIKDKKSREKPYVLAPDKRVYNFYEVSLGYKIEEVLGESGRCLECKKPKCVGSCPVGIDIPGFIQRLKNNDIRAAAEHLLKYTKLPSICGRVCPQERQCEGECVVGKKREPIAIGLLERYVGDWSLKNIKIKKPKKNGKKVAVIGSGPAGLAASAELATYGYEVDVFESLHKLGGVLVYGIPEFRLPKDIVESEINRIKDLGVKFHTNIVVGKTLLIDDLLDKKGYEAVFVGSGAGFPKFMGIKGENALGVLSANEFLTRVNLMGGNKKEYETPTTIGKKVAVIGAGNVSMDAARVAKRLGVETSIVYRRSFDEIPARAEEVEHAMEENIKFKLLTNPLEILSDDNGRVYGLKCIKMKLTEPDSEGRRKPVPIEGSEFVMDVDTVIISIGTSPNDLITSTTSNLQVSLKGTIILKEGSQTCTTREGVFAGGDIVTGAATVIKAMGAGKSAAKEIHEYIVSKAS